MPSRPAPNIDLGQHSLNAVVGRNKALWQSPPKWTQAHLEALCIDRQSVADLGDVDGDQDDGLSFHAVIPTLPPDRLRRSINTLNGPDSSWLLVQALDKMLAFWPRPSKPQHDDVDVDNHVKLSSSPRLDIEPPAFSHFQKCTVKLRVGPRAYPLRLLFSFHLGSLVLPFFDAFTIDNHDYLAHRRHLSNEPYEPYITAILIALAQTKPFSTGESAVVTRLLFGSRRDDDRNMYIYTAFISPRLLERFRSPNQPPTTRACPDTTPPPLVTLRHRAVPYEPNVTFRHRLLAAVSVNATIKHQDEYYRRKRKSSDAWDIIDVKKRRLEGPQTSLSQLGPVLLPDIAAL